MADDPQQSDQTALVIFDDEGFDSAIRCTMHDGRMFFSVIDVIGSLTESTYANRYWSDLKRKLIAEGATQPYEKIVRLKLRSPDGKMRETDCADQETLLRILQSVPSPKAEPFKQWLARVGTERLAEMEDPARAVERMRKEYRRLGYSDAWIDERLKNKEYRRLGYSDAWIDERLKNIATRNALTDEWRERDAEEGRDFARLTDTLSHGSFDLTTGEHRQVKHLGTRANLRDSMTPMELVLTSLAEVTATELHQTRESRGYDELRDDAQDAGKVAGNARREVEAITGKPVVSPLNYKTLRQERQRALQPSLLDSPPDEE